MNALSVIKKEEPQLKRKRERPALIETPPKADWFVCTQERGRKVWYLRLSITGMLPRRFGPFKNRHRAMLALDAMLNCMADSISDLPNSARKYRLCRRFDQTWGPIIEDTLALAYRNRNRRCSTIVQS